MWAVTFCFILCIGLATPLFTWNGNATSCCNPGTLNGECDETKLGLLDGALRTFFSGEGGTPPPGFTQLLTWAGCWCQNNGYGPSSPNWFTCPGGAGLALLAAYYLQPIHSLTSCHCNCPTPNTIEDGCTYATQ